MDRKNLVMLAAVLVAVFAVNSYGQIVDRDQLLSVNQKLDQYKVGQSTIASGAFSLYDYYGTIGLVDIKVMYGEVGVHTHKTIELASSIQDGIARNLDNYENVRTDVRNKLSGLRETHNLAQRRLNETVQEVQRVRPTIARPALLSDGEAGTFVANSYQDNGVLHYSDAAGEQTIVVTSQQVRNGELPDIIAAQLPAGGSRGTTFIEFNQTAGAQQQTSPTDVIPECTLRLQYAVDAVSGSDLVSSQLIALGGVFNTPLPSCMFRIAGVSFYSVEPASATENAIYCALPPGFSGAAEAWVIGKGCRESGHVPFVSVQG